jgi:hypothetical protein
VIPYVVSVAIYFQRLKRPFPTGTGSSAALHVTGLTMRREDARKDSRLGKLRVCLART